VLNIVSLGFRIDMSHGYCLASDLFLHKFYFM
jgi:hypothetical protein